MGLQRKCVLAAWMTLAVLAATPSDGQIGNVKHVHDPAIISPAAGTYYVFSTGHGIPIRRSSDLIHWRDAGPVFCEDVPAWARQKIPQAKFPWAPDVSFFKGRYWLYYSISTFGSQRSCIGLATNTTLDPSQEGYRWVDHGKVIDSQPGRDDFNAIDPAAFTDEEGRRWMVWGSWSGGIKLTRLDPETGRKLSADAPVYSVAARPQRHAIEAPYIIFHSGYYYLFVSFDCCCQGVNSTYKIMVGRGRQPAGPYLDFAGRPMTVGGGTLVLAGHGDCRGPGHNSILQEAEKTYLVHHMYDAAADGVPTLQIRPLIWSSDGWPLAMEPMDRHPSRPDPDKIRNGDLVGTWHHSVDFGTGFDLALLADGRIDNAGSGARWQLLGNRLRLTWPARAAPGGAWVDECYVHMAVDAMFYVGRNQNGQVIRGVRTASKPD